MAFEDHFHLNLDYETNSYYRVTKENKEKFKELKNTIISKAKKKKPVSINEINNLFTMLIDIEDEEFRHYLSEADLYTSYVVEYFENSKDYFWQELIPGKGDKVDYWDSAEKKFVQTYLEDISDEGFQHMIMSILHEYIIKDKGRNPPLEKSECIVDLIEALLKYRRDFMKEVIKPLYTCYRIRAVAAAIADIVFNLIKEPKPGKKPTNHERYYFLARQEFEIALSKYPELFEGVPTGKTL